MKVETNRRIVLRYDEPGQFSFSRFDHAASDQQLYELGTLLNRFQEDEATKILKVQTFDIM